MTPLPGIDRRTTLKWLAAALAFSAHHHKVLAGTFQVQPQGYGSDPDLNNPKAPWPLLMSERERQLAAALADLILPEEGEHPSAATAGIHDFIDEWISAPYPDQLEDRPIIRDGLAWIDQRGFLGLDPTGRTRLVDEMNGDSSPAHDFFRRFRHLVVAAYYSSDAGAKELGYIGNVPLDSFPAPTEEALAIIERECRALGV